MCEPHETFYPKAMFPNFDMNNYRINHTQSDNYIMRHFILTKIEVLSVKQCMPSM